MIDWKKKAVIYQIYPKSYLDSNNDGIGDIEGIIRKIPYLKELGINTVWLSPIYQSPMADNGYDISDYTKIHPMFGSLNSFKKLVDDLHHNDIKLMMDLVLNHTSDEHPWFIESRTNPQGPKGDFYIWRKGRKNNKKPPNNWTSFFTGKAWSYDSTRDEYYLHLFGSKQPDLNWDNVKVREELHKMIHYWVTLGVDGFRLDVINLISKCDGLPKGKKRIALTGKEHYMNGPRVHEYIKNLYHNVFKEANAITVGETVFVTPEEALAYCNIEREELDMVFQFEHMNVDSFNNKWFIMPFRPKKLKKILYRWQKELYPKGWNALYFENHDQPRSVSRFGNTKQYYEKSAKLLATILYFQRGTPYIYQGQEIGMLNAQFEKLDQYRDVETLNVYKLGRETLHFTHQRMMKKIKYMSRDNARTPMQWSPHQYAGFSKTAPWIEVNSNYKDINVKSQENDSNSILSYYKKIINLRKTNVALIEGDFIPYLTCHKSLYLYTRNTDKCSVLVVANHSVKDIRFSLPKTLDFNLYRPLLANDDVRELTQKMTLKPYEAQVYITKKR